MSIEEARRYGEMKEVDKKKLTLREASVELGLSLRQLKRVKKKYQIEGTEGLTSKRRGRVSPNATDPQVKAEELTTLKSEEYAGFGPTFARDKIEERQGHCLSSETVRKWMTSEGLWIPKNKKKSKA